MATIHFHSGDARFCGAREQARQFSLDPDEVTCEACKGNDGFVLSPQGRAYLDELDSDPVEEKIARIRDYQSHGYGELALDVAVDALRALKRQS